MSAETETPCAMHAFALANIRAAALIMSIGVRVRPPRTGGSDWLLAASLVFCSFAACSQQTQGHFSLSGPFTGNDSNTYTGLLGLDLELLPLGDCDSDHEDYGDGRHHCGEFEG